MATRAHHTVFVSSCLFLCIAHTAHVGFTAKVPLLTTVFPTYCCTKVIAVVFWTRLVAMLLGSFRWPGHPA